jgi:uncharacterized protein (DUF952 family)
MALIFHIASLSDWMKAEACGSYETASLASAGFIHCSSPHQVIEVANRLFRARADLLLLHIETARVGAEVRFENADGGDQQYPHIYGELNIDAVVDVSKFDASSHGTFDHHAALFAESEQ